MSQYWDKIFLFFFILEVNCVSWIHWPANCCEIKGLQYLCYPKCYAKCVLRPNPVEKMRQLLMDQFFGQDHAREYILNMLETYSEINSHQKPTSFHIAGDNGVGKSYLVRLIAEALYLYNTEGLLIISGSNFQGHRPDLVELYQRTLFNMIFQHLEQCPDALIVIDEVQYVHSSTLTVLKQFLDETGFVSKIENKVKKVSTNRAIFGFISDFGQEGRTQDMSFSQLEELVIVHTSQLWDLDAKQVQLIQYTFPFVTLSNAEIENILNYTIIKTIPSENLRKYHIQKVTVSPSAIIWMRQMFRKKYPLENGRGASNYMTTELLPRLRKAIADKTPPLFVDIKYKKNDLYFEVTEKFRSEL